jgi:raffinose/stachyose/melibiose transport system substrate-binding protein
VKQRRYTGFWTIAACFLLVLTSIGLQPAVAQETVELTVWDTHTGEVENAAADQIYGAFMEANPNIEIIREVYSVDNMRQTVNTAIASGTGPDIIFYDAGPGYAGVLAQAGLLTPIDEYAEQYGWGERIAEQSLEATTLGGELYGLPLQVDLIGMYYNQTLIEEAGLTVPQTYEELLTFCQGASEAGYVPLAFTNNPGWQGFHQFSMIVNNILGPDWVQEKLLNNQGEWDSPEVVEAINSYFVEMRDAGCFSEDVNALTNDDANALFQSGEALMWPTGSWMASGLNPETMPDMELGYMPFPALENGAGSFWVSGVGSAYYITETSEHKDEAALFLEYLFSPTVAAQWVDEAGFFVPMAVDRDTLELTPLQDAILTELQRAAAGEIELGYNIDVLAPPRFNETLQSGIQAVLAGDMTAEELATRIQAAWEESWQGQGTPEASPAS